jgi:hypothetical protein
MGFFKYRYSAVQEDIDEEDIQFIQDAEVCSFDTPMYSVSQ